MFFSFSVRKFSVVDIKRCRRGFALRSQLDDKHRTHSVGHLPRRRLRYHLPQLVRDILLKTENIYIILGQEFLWQGGEKGKRVWNLAIVALVTIWAAEKKECGQRYEATHLEHIAT